MKKLYVIPALLLLIIAGCKQPSGIPGTSETFIKQATMDNVIKQLTDSCGEINKFRIERGVKQAATLWQKDDGSAEEFVIFCSENFIHL